MCQSADFLSDVDASWSENTVCELKKLLKQFLVLQTHGDQGVVPETTTLEDMSAWLMSRRCPNRQMPKLCEEVHAEVARGLRMVSPSVTFEPAASLHSPAEVLVDLVPRLQLSLMAQHGKALPREQRGWLALTDIVLSAVLRVLDNLASALDTLDLKVHYSPATGIRMVGSIQKLIGKLQGSEELSLTSRMVDAVTIKVQRLFQQHQDCILTEAVFIHLSETKDTVHKRGIFPAGPSTQPLILHSEDLRTLVGLAVVQIFDGHIEAQLDVSNWPIFDEVENLLYLYNMRTSKKMEKVNLRLSAEEIVRMASELHNSLHNAFGSKQNLQMAVKHRVKVLTRFMCYEVVEMILQLRDHHLVESMAEESSVQFAINVPVVVETSTSPGCFSALWKVLRSCFTKKQAQKRGSSVEKEEWRAMDLHREPGRTTAVPQHLMLLLLTDHLHILTCP
ncbi:unnamed protein product [Lota lota]